MWRRWNERGSPGRFELWTRASVYVLLAAVPVLAVVLAAGHQVRVPGLAVFLLLSVAQAGVCIALLHAGLSRYLAGGPQPNRWLVSSAAALTPAGVLAGAAAFPAFTLPPGTDFPVSLLVTMLFGGALMVALTPLLSLRALLVLVLVSAAVASGLTASAGRDGAGAHGGLLIGAFLLYAFVVGVGVFTCRASAWTLRIMSELDRSRTAHARLSVAEERLRFARDLHDVLGRNLSLIAVQSELAAELARRGDQDAAGHMLEVRQVAHESLRDMRAVISGYRTADLGTELAGAQEVLRSAGMSCRVIGDAADLPPDVQAALGWVVREGTTNIIRHSDATACTIELHILDSSDAPRAVTLSMDNDRVHTLAAGSGGSGLLGLGERLAGPGVGSTPLCGLAHGAAGMGLALIEAGVACGRDDWLEGGVAAFRYEDQLYDTHHENWPDLRERSNRTGDPSVLQRTSSMVAWCHGAAGIGLTRLRAIQLVPERRAELMVGAKRALRATIQHLRTLRHTPTHHHAMARLDWPRRCCSRPKCSATPNM